MKVKSLSVHYFAMLKEAIVGAVIASYGWKLVRYSTLSREEKREKSRTLWLPLFLDMLVEGGEKASDMYFGLLRRKPSPQPF